MKRIIAITTALVFMLSAGTTVSAAHHIPCIGRMLQSGAFCQNGENCDIEHHWFRHGGGEGGCFWNVDIQAPVTGGNPVTAFTEHREHMTSQSKRA